MKMGYAVFEPDIPVVGGGRACDGVAQDVGLSLNAIDRAQLADTTRAAIIGHSFGGWAVNCVITRMGRFKAAISIAGISDLLSASFSAVGSEAIWAIGGGQTNIGKSIWEAPDLYWQDSPISGVQNVTTPLLLIHGKLDHTVPIEQSAEMYTALSHLGKEVTMVAYDDADHRTVLTHPDYGRRVVAWIRQNLDDKTYGGQD
jgi:dipeptidyl aminopeptidase/acylaminoacyl peptidase